MQTSNIVGNHYHMIDRMPQNEYIRNGFSKNQQKWRTLRMWVSGNNTDPQHVVPVRAWTACAESHCRLGGGLALLAALITEKSVNLGDVNCFIEACKPSDLRPVDIEQPSVALGLRALESRLLTLTPTSNGGSKAFDAIKIALSEGRVQPSRLEAFVASKASKLKF